MPDDALAPVRRRNRLLIHRLTEIRRTVGGHPESPTPLEAIAGVRSLAPSLRRHFAEVREAFPEHAERLAPDQRALLVRFAQLAAERRRLADAHLLARDVRDHLRRVESEVLVLRAA